MVKLREPNKRIYRQVDAWGARLYYRTNQGLGLDEIEPWPVILFHQLTETDFIARDGDGNELCRVEFVDNDGNARVTFPDGESGMVHVKEVKRQAPALPCSVEGEGPRPE